MKVNRRFTKAGRSVFDTVSWQKRTSRIANPDGSVVFEMRDAEVPTTWSQLATDIMVSKYFRKAGVPQTPAGKDPIAALAEGDVLRDDHGRVITGPERSVKQVVHRLAGCWRHWGEQHGYFDSAADAEAFYDELAYMLVHQFAAPNSPQWFNTGLNWAYGMSGPPQGHWYVDPHTQEVKLAPDAYTHPQPHACFIQSVEDDLVNPGGIMDLWVREARLFKYGSGTGTNFSRLRGEEEPLSGGGRSSGLMSWLRIGDRAAGAIKSGGTTRRAAKMVCLDLDHPDIEAFVNWKVREEIKVAAMVEGMKRLSEEQKRTAAALGLKLDYDFNGEAYYTVSGQNSNNSVRINNDFFRRLDENGEWELRRRIDGKVSRCLPSGQLWDQIAYAAWRCADPGVQFDTTINQWHTCPASGRINASNPCVTGDTLVATAQGYRRIADLAGQTVEIVNGAGQRVWVDKVFPTGRKPVYELRTRAGYRLKLTADHKVRTLDRGDVPACELTRDDRVKLERPGFGDDFVPEAFGELLGAALGDGCLTHQPEQDFVFVNVGHGERGVAEHLRDAVAHCKQWLASDDRRGQRPTHVVETATSLRVGTSVAALVARLQSYAVLDGGAASKALTDRVFQLDRRSQAAILRGLFTTDGTVANYGEKSQYVALDSASRELLQQVQLLLLGFGIKSRLYENRRAIHQTSALLPDGKGGVREYPVRQMHSLRISRASRLIFEQEIGFFAESPKAARLAELNRQVGVCGDPLSDRVASLTPCGVEDVYDLTEPVTQHFVANGIVVHNCSEYMFLDNTACNLASLNLLRFYDAKERRFDVAGFEHAVELWTVVLEISVLMAAFPSKEIARLSYEFRTLGLGYANIGAMLMQAGIAYDSEESRALCAAITAIMTGRGYAASARMAAELGPFPGYYKNRESMLRVIRNHRRAAHGVPRRAVPLYEEQGLLQEMGDYEGLEIKPVPLDTRFLKNQTEGRGGLTNAEELLRHARSAWDAALDLGNRHGYRNAQTTVIAPTGTIGLLMDCDTTGVEPDFALVKFKKLAGGGYFKIINQSVKPALESLGYSRPQVRDILTYVMGRLSLDVPMPDQSGNTVDGAPTFAAFLRGKGLTDADVARLSDALAGAMELGFVFNAFTLGDEALARLGLQDKRADVLKALGLARAQVERLNELTCGTGTVEGAPHLQNDHLAVFDCANKCGRKGQRYIAPEGHIRMMAAAQPFVTGAISKTINLPHDATVEDIKRCYRLSWELGLKANALYRDGCKLSQPLNATADAPDAQAEDEEGIEAGKEEVAAAVADVASRIASAETELGGKGHDQAAAAQPIEKIVERIVYRPLRRRLADTRRSLTHKFNVAGHEGYITVGLYDDNTPGELFITMAKEGSTIGGLMDSLGTAISIALQYGVPVEALINKFTHQRFEPAGMTHNPDIPFAKSLVDYIFRWMGMEFIPGYRAANAPRRTRPLPDADDQIDQTPARTKVDRIVGGGRESALPRRGEGGDRADTAITDAARPAARGNGNGHDGDEAAAPATDGAPLPSHPLLNVNDESDLPRTLTEGQRELAQEYGPAQPGGGAMLATAMKELQADAPACDVCGTITVRSGTCYKCLNCGQSMGCS